MKVVRHVQVNLPVQIEVRPHRAETIAAPGDARRLRRIGELHLSRLAVIAVKTVVCPDSLAAPVVVVEAPDVVVRLLPLFDSHRPIRELIHRQLRRRAIRIFDTVREQIHVEVAVPIRIRKIRTVRTVHRIHPRRAFQLREDALSIVEEELIRLHVVAQIKVEIAVPIHIRRRSARRPRIPAIEPRALRSGIFKFQPASVAIEHIRPRRPGEKNIRFPIAIEVRRDDSTRRHPRVVKVAHRVIHVHLIDRRDARLLGRELGKKRLPRASRPGCEWLGFYTGRKFSRVGSTEDGNGR